MFSELNNLKIITFDPEYEGICGITEEELLTQSLLYALLVGVGADVHSEEQTADGRIDISLKLEDAIYIIEFKYDKTAEAAVSQIQRKNYAVLFSSDPRPVYAIGLNIDSEKRSIESYKITLAVGR